MVDDSLEDGVHVGEEGWVVRAPEGGGDAVGAELEGVGLEGEVAAGLGPVAELVDKDPVVGVGFKLDAGGFGGGVRADDAEEDGGLVGGELRPVGGGKGIGVHVVVAEGGDVVDDEGGDGDGAGKAGGPGLLDEGIAEAWRAEKSGAAGVACACAADGAESRPMASVRAAAREQEKRRFHDVALRRAGIRDLDWVLSGMVRDCVALQSVDDELPFLGALR